MHSMRRLLAGLTAIALLVLLVQPAMAADATPPSAEQKPEPPKEEAKPPALDSGDTAWMLVSTGLVLLMVPGLALFYGGMVRRKNILGAMMHSMVALAIIGIQWVLFGYSLAFGESQGGLIGWTSNLLGLHGIRSIAIFPN